MAMVVVHAWCLQAGGFLYDFGLFDYISGISILGMPAEMYTYGTQFWMIVGSQGFVATIMSFVYLPVFYKLQIISSYEYLNLRFNQNVRTLGSILFLTKMLFYIPIVIYVPALAFGQVTGINLHMVTPIVCVICIFYTTIGGLKAVVWTDTIQTVVMFGALVAVLIMGTVKVGGPLTIWERNKSSGRLEFFNMNPDPTIRHTFWTMTVGNFFGWLASCSINQAMVQRCLAMPNLRSARITIVILVLGISSLVTMCCYSGLLIYATYWQCDPVTTGAIGKADQLLPYFVMQISQAVPGLPGLFVSGVFSAALSSMSTGLNSMTGVIFEDLVRPLIKRQPTEAQASLVLKLFVIIVGAICVALVFVVEKMGALIQASGSMSGITAGPLLGIFSLGMLFPEANSVGALVGGISSISLVAWMSIGSQLMVAAGRIRYPQKPVSVEDCGGDWVFNATSPLTPPVITQLPPEPPLLLYQFSYMWYTMVGAFTAIVVGLAVSYMTGRNKGVKMSKDLFAPMVHGRVDRMNSRAEGMKQNGDKMQMK